MSKLPPASTTERITELIGPLRAGAAYAPGSLFRVVVEHMADGVIVADRRGDVVLLNRAARRLIGLGPEEPIPVDWASLPGRHLSDGITPVPADRLWVNRALTGEQVEGDLSLFRHPGIPDTWVRGSARPIRGESGEVVGCVVVWHEVTAEIRAEQALRESNERFEAIFGGISDAAVFADTQRRIVLTNPAFTRMFGYSADEVRERTTEFLYADPAEYVRQGKDRYHVDGSSRNDTFEVRYRRKDGSVFWSETLGTSIRGHDGAVLGYFGIHRDITGRKAMEEELRRREEEFRAMFELAAVGAAQADPDTGRFVRVNRKFCEITGYSADELLRKTFAEITHPEDRDRDVASVRRAVSGEASGWVSEKRYLRKDGNIVWASINGTVLRDAQGRPLHTVANIVDISARKRAEESLTRLNANLEQEVAKRAAQAENRADALRQSERFAKSTIDALESHLCVLDEQGRIIAANRAWHNFAAANGGDPARLGEGADYLGTCQAAARRACESAARFAAGLQAVLRGTRRRFSLEYECSSDTEERWFHARVTRFPGRGPLRIVVIHENITALKHAQDELRQAAARLRRLTTHLESVREEQAARIAREVHDELGGILTVIKLGLASILGRPLRPDTLPAHLQRIREQADMAIQAVKRISASLRPGMLDTLGLMATIRWHAAEFARHTGILVQLELPEQVNLSAERDTAVFRIVQEALTNVARHAEATRVTIAVRRQKGALQVNVTDNGCGYAEDSLTRPDSFGIQGMMERAQFLGGQLQITPAAGGGTALSLRLPLKQEEPEA